MVVYPYQAINDDELNLAEGQVVNVVSREVEDKASQVQIADLSCLDLSIIYCTCHSGGRASVIHQPMDSLLLTFFTPILPNAQLHAIKKESES